MTYGGEEHIMKSFEVLLSHRDLHWKSMTIGLLPKNALETGYEKGHPLYSIKKGGSVYSGRKISIGKYSHLNKTAYFTSNGKEREVTRGVVEVLNLWTAE